MLKTLVVFALMHQSVLWASTACDINFKTQPIWSVQKAVQQNVVDTDSQIVIFSASDEMNLIAKFDLNFRPDFALVVIPTRDEKSLLALVPKRRGSPSLLGQQVVQWQLLDVNPKEVSSVIQQNKDGALKIKVGHKTVKTKLVISSPVQIIPTSWNSLIAYLKANPLVTEVKANNSIKILQMLFGKVWIQMIGSKGQFNALDSSKAVLEEKSLIVPGKEKVLHVVGKIFSAELEISSESPFTGQLSSGKYFVVARLSSSLKNFSERNEKGELEPNSLALALLLFKSKDQLEVPGMLFVQDSLVPVVNTNLKQFQLTNNPAFGFKPKSIREFFEQGVTIVGVALSSFLNPRDSGRGIQANYRSTLGAASSGVILADGAKIFGPRFVSVQAIENEFALKASEDGENWVVIGRMNQVDELNLDSHELTFPHGLSGTIDPQTLKPQGSNQGLKGILLPVKTE